MIENLDLSQTFRRTTWSFIVLINDSKHICARHAARNKWLKHDLHQLKLFWTENSYETFRAKSVETCLTATLYHLTALKFVRIKTLASDEFRIITNNLHLNYAEYGLQTWFHPPKRVLVKGLRYSYSMTKSVNMTNSKRWNSCIGNRHTSYLFGKWV